MLKSPLLNLMLMSAMFHGSYSFPKVKEPKLVELPRELTDEDRRLLEKARLRREKKEAAKAAQRKKKS